MRESLERKRRCRTSLVCTSTTPPPPREGCSAVCRASFLSAGGEMCCSRVVVVVRLIIPAPPPPPPILNICAQQPRTHQPSAEQSTSRGQLRRQQVNVCNQYLIIRTFAIVKWIMGYSCISWLSYFKISFGTRPPLNRNKNQEQDF